MTDSSWIPGICTDIASVRAASFEEASLAFARSNSCSFSCSDCFLVLVKSRISRRFSDRRPDDDIRPEEDVMRPEVEDIIPEVDDIRPEVEDLRPEFDVIMPEVVDLIPEVDEDMPEVEYSIFFFARGLCCCCCRL